MHLIMNMTIVETLLGVIFEYQSYFYLAVFLRIFTVAFLLFLAPMRGSNAAGQPLTLNQPNLT